MYMVFFITTISTRMKLSTTSQWASFISHITSITDSAAVTPHSTVICYTMHY